MAAECEIDKSNLGLSKCKNLPQLIRGMITTPSKFSLTKEDAADPEKWQDALVDSKGARIYLWPNFKGFEDVSEEAVYEDTPLADIKVRDGKYRYRFHIEESLCLHKAMFSHRATSGRVFFIDVEGQLIGTELANGNLAGFNLSLLNTEKLTISDGSVATKSPVYVVLQDNKEMDRSGVTFNGDFVNSLERLTDVTLTVESASATSVVVKVVVSCDGTPVNGLALADFVLLATNGDVQTITGVAEVDGVYTLTGTALVSGTVNLVAAKDLTVLAFESTGAVAVTIA
jgi:hypothetical protein